MLLRLCLLITNQHVLLLLFEDVIDITLTIYIFRDVTSDEVCFVDIAVVSFCLEALVVKFVSIMPHKLFLLLVPLCGPLVIRWCIWRSPVFTTRLDYVQRWKLVSRGGLVDRFFSCG